MSVVQSLSSTSSPPLSSASISYLHLEKIRIGYYHYVCKKCVLWHSPIVFRMICVCDNILVYHVKSLGSSSKQPKITTCPDWVNQQDWQQCQVPDCVHVFSLTRVWALASPASALSFNCSTDKSSCRSLSGGGQDALNVHFHLDQWKVTCWIRGLHNTLEHCGCTAFYSVHTTDGQLSLTYLVTWEWQEVRGGIDVRVCAFQTYEPICLSADTLWQDPWSTLSSTLTPIL